MKQKSTILLSIGMIVLLVGAVLSMMKIEPWADYVLVAGALLIIIRGAMYSRERSRAKHAQPNEPANATSADDSPENIEK